MFIILLSDKREPVYFADSMIFTIVAILNITRRSLDIAINKFFLILLFNPFALLKQIKQELARKEPLIYSVIDSDRQVTGSSLALYQSLDVHLNQVRNIVEGIDSDTPVEWIERQTLIILLLCSQRCYIT
jgi:hypothetical protein